jgi:hypothetical protein
MASQELLTLLAKGVEQWNEGRYEQDIRSPDLVSARLQGILCEELTSSMPG